ncbi:hypothetical protein GCM10027416_24480 [Okibacterium endophyticum]
MKTTEVGEIARTTHVTTEPFAASDGVEAAVNLATEKAHVEYTGKVTVDDLVRAVAAAGYTAAVEAPKRMP